MHGYVLSGEHETLPYEELKAILDIFKVKSKVERINRYALVEDSPVLKVIERSGYIDEGHEVIFKYKYREGESLNNFFKEFDNFLRNYKLEFKGSYAVRTLKLFKDDYTKNLNSLTIERGIGGIIKRHSNAKVNLEEPDNLFRVVIEKDFIFISKVLAFRDREYFRKNRPHLRKYFHPGCIMPKLARAMVNLARVKENDIVLDPFCGTGGFLIEAGLLGAKLIGCDIDWRMSRGTLINLEDYNLLNNVIKIKTLDAKYVKDFLRELNIDKVDAIVTDPPYGISTAKKGEVENILYELPEVIKEGGYFVFAYPKFIELNLKLENLFKIYIHKNLIRHIHVYRV
ncbi:TIGR01177 family methyltransferase [Methanocaldococcus infernus]